MEHPAPKKRAVVLCDGSTAFSGTYAISNNLAEAFRILGWSCEVLCVSAKVFTPGSPTATLELRRVLHMLAKGGTEVVHPGVGVWAERPEVVSICHEIGLSVLSPSPRIVSLFNTKLYMIAQAEKLGVPNLVLSSEPIHTTREIELFLAKEKVALPVVLKSIRGVGLVSAFVVRLMEDLDKKLELWIEELQRNIGEAIFYVERYCEAPKNIIVPFVRFASGTVRIFDFVDVSLQSRNREIVEFCPAQGIDAQTSSVLQKHTKAIASACDFVGFGTLEFINEGEKVFLTNGYAHLNLGYSLWSDLCGINVVDWQLQIATGAREEQEAKKKFGVAVNIYAEDPILQLPQPGFVSEIPSVTSWRYGDSSAEFLHTLESGKNIDFASDGYLGRLTVYSSNFTNAINLSRGVMSDIWLSGGFRSNEAFILELLSHPWVREGIFHSNFLDEEFLPPVCPPPEVLPLMSGVASLVGKADKSKWIVADRWAEPESKLPWVDAPVFFDFEGKKGVSGALEIGLGRRQRICAFPITEESWLVRIEKWSARVRQVATVEKSASKVKTYSLYALVSGKVHSILYKTNASVPAHENLITIESFRRLISHALPVDVRILSWRAKADDFVVIGQELAKVHKLVT